MFDLGWTELLVIGIVALIVIGPKDLPMLFRRVGQFVGKTRAMAREFSRAMDDAADEAGVKDVSKTLKAASNPLKTSIDQVKQATSEFAAYDPGNETRKLAAERKEAAQKIHAEAKKRALKKRAAEQKDQSTPETSAAAQKQTGKKTAQRKSAKPVTATTSAKATATNTTAVEKAATQKAKATRKSSKAKLEDDTASQDQR